MNGQTDSQLVHAYSEQGSEAAFAELVRRYVDLVYSAARRIVHDPHLAEDVTQSVFVALAKSAAKLTERPVLSGWLHRTAQNIAAQTVRTEVRRRAREEKAVAMNDLLASETDTSWKQIAPYLDSALGELNEPDRDVLLLRFFQGKSAREIAETITTSEEAAQKRLSRAAERLRALFAKRGIAIGSSGLAVVLSANAIEAAPAGLAATVSTAALAAGTSASAATTTSVIAMTTLQKVLIAAALVAALGVGIYKTRKPSPAQVTTATLGQPASSDDVSALQARIEQLGAQNAGLTSALAQAMAEKARLEKERDQARHAAALFKELAAQASLTENTTTNEYPSARHTLVGFGKLARRQVEMSQREEADLTPEEKAANDELKLNWAVEALNLTKLAKRFGIYAGSGSATNLDSADNAACFLLGALDLSEQQFSTVFNVMQNYSQAAVSPPREGEEQSRENEEAVKRLEEQAREGIRSILSEEQARIFSLMLANMHFLNPDDGKAGFGYSLGENQNSKDAE